MAPSEEAGKVTIKVLELPRCGVLKCERVSTRRVWHLYVDGKLMGEVRLCYQCEQDAEELGAKLPEAGTQREAER